MFGLLASLFSYRYRPIRGYKSNDAVIGNLKKHTPQFRSWNDFHCIRVEFPTMKIVIVGGLS